MVTYNINWSLLLGQSDLRDIEKKTLQHMIGVRKSEKTALKERQKPAMYFKIRTRRYKKTAKKPSKNKER